MQITIKYFLKEENRGEHRNDEKNLQPDNNKLKYNLCLQNPQFKKQHQLFGHLLPTMQESELLGNQIMVIPRSALES
jgi:hypothetical protein